MPADWAFDPSDDWQFWEGLEPVEYVSRRPGDEGDVSRPGVLALRATSRLNELAPTGGGYTGADVAWIVPCKLLPGIAPAPADRVIDEAGAVWTVLSVDRDPAAIAWTCHSRDRVIAHALSGRLTLWRPTATKDAAGATVRTWTQVASVAARWQPQEDTEADVLGRKGLKSRFRVFVERELAVRSEDQVRDGAGVPYEVRTYQQSRRIDELPALDVELLP